MNAKEFIADAIRYIETKYPETIKFVPDEAVLKSLELHLRTKKFTTPLYLYGIRFILAFLEYCVETEEFEVCSAILKAINEHNEKIGDNLPTSLENCS